MAKEFITLQLKEEGYTFRALDLDQLEELEPEFELLQKESSTPGPLSKEGRQAAVKIVHTSLQFKHPELQLDAVRKLLTLGTIEAALMAVRGVSQIQGAGQIGSASGEGQAGSR